MANNAGEIDLGLSPVATKVVGEGVVLHVLITTNGILSSGQLETSFSIALHQVYGQISLRSLHGHPND